MSIEGVISGKWRQKMASKHRHIFLKVILSIVAIILLIVLLYVAYVFISYHRLDDNIALEVQNPIEGSVEKGKKYKLVSWNIGFGAYEEDYSFFMDGGKESWARSKDGLLENLDDIMSELRAYKGDFYIIQEVDKHATRSYHVDETRFVADTFPEMSHVYAENWDSAFLAYPFTQPHGATEAGIMTFSSVGITSGLRRSLPIENSVMKLVDLDRCYSVSRIPGPDGHELVLYNLHLSAYTSDGTIAIDQLKLLLSDMQSEYEKGNWAIGGGDFNKDILGGGSELFGVTGSNYNWAQPIPAEVLEGYDISLVGPYDAENPVPSCRNPDTAYWEGQYQITVDGFIVSDNVEVLTSRVIDTGFQYSDHNPVFMEFVLR